MTEKDNVRVSVPFWKAARYKFNLERVNSVPESCRLLAPLDHLEALLGDDPCST
jgi:hypothetical protein